MNTIILIGFMGAGKSTVGRVLARKLKWNLIDTDQYLEEKEGRTITEIFAENGEAYFREKETEYLKELLQNSDQTIISCGGGLPMKKENRELLKASGNVVFLSIRPETVYKRLKGDKTRPLLQGTHVMEKINSLLTTRNPLYEEAANSVIAVDEESSDAVARMIIEKI